MSTLDLQNLKDQKQQIETEINSKQTEFQAELHRLEGEWRVVDRWIANMLGNAPSEDSPAQPVHVPVVSADEPVTTQEG